MSWKNKRYKLIENTFTWEHDFTKTIFASDSIELVKDYMKNSGARDICTASGGKVFYILDATNDEVIIK